MKLGFFYFIDRLIGSAGKFFLLLFLPRKSGNLPEKVKHIVIFKFLGGGSLTLAAPALLALKEHFPEAETILLTTPGICGNAKLLNIFDRIEVFSPFKPFTACKTFFKLKKRVSSPENLVIDLELYSRFSHAVSAWTASKCFSTGLAMPEEKHFWDKVVRFNKDLPMYRHYDRLAILCGGKVSSMAVQNFYRNHKMPENRIVIAPFCSNLSLRRKWETGKFAALLDELLSIHPELTALIIGAEENAAEAEILCSMLSKEIAGKVESWCGKADFSTAFEAIRRSKLFIGVDSAPLHLARLSAVPAVSIWGATVPEHLTREFENYPEVMISAGLSCSPCVHRKTIRCPLGKSCTASVEVEQVFQAAKALIENKITEKVREYKK